MLSSNTYEPSVLFEEADRLRGNLNNSTDIKEDVGNTLSDLNRKALEEFVNCVNDCGHCENVSHCINLKKYELSFFLRFNFLACIA